MSWLKKQHREIKKTQECNVENIESKSQYNALKITNILIIFFNMCHSMFFSYRQILILIHTSCSKRNLNISLNHEDQIIL